jgi:beta-glucanase (GH16 family)
MLDSMFTPVFASFFLLFIGACADKSGQSQVDKMVEEPKTYQLVWSDEFDYSGRPDSTKWTYEQGFVRNEELQWYQPDNVFCENGLLVVEGRKETIPNPNYKPGSTDWMENRKEATFTSASVTTKGLHSWRYGRFEIKAKIKAQDGLWPAIWSLGSNHEWPAGGEIDIMEYYNGYILANAAWAGAQRWPALWDDFRKPVTSFNDPEWADKFHIWKMDWTYDSIKIYVDDELLNTISLDKTINQRGSVSNPFRETSQFLILNLAIGGTAGGDPSDTPFPSRYEIEYVRVYQK